MDRYCGVISTWDYPNIPRKCSRLSQEGRTTTPSTGTPSEHQQSSQRILSAESANRSTADFLDTLRINTPTLENVGNSSRPENISGKFLIFCLFLLNFVVFKFMYLSF